MYNPEDLRNTVDDLNHIIEYFEENCEDLSIVGSMAEHIKYLHNRLCILKQMLSSIRLADNLGKSI